MVAASQPSAPGEARNGTARAAACWPGQRGHPAEDRQKYRHVKYRDKRKGIAPEVMPKPKPPGTPTAANHPRHRGGLPGRDFRQDKSRRRQRTPRGKPGNQPAKRQHGVATGEGKQGIAENTQASQNSITDFRETAGEQRHDRAPITTPKAYRTVIILPAAGMDIPTSCAISGSTPIMPNSAMPSPKVPSASENRFFIHLIGVLRAGRHYLLSRPDTPAKNARRQFPPYNSLIRSCSPAAWHTGGVVVETIPIKISELKEINTSLISS